MTDAIRELLIACRNMSSRTVAISALVAVTTIAIPFFWDVSEASAPRWVRFGALHAAFVVAVSLVIIIFSDRLRKLRNKPHPFCWSALAMIALIGALIGAIVAPIVWSIVPPDSVDAAAREPEERGGAAPPMKADHPVIAAEKPPAPDEEKGRKISDTSGRLGPKEGLRLEGRRFGGGVWIGNAIVIVKRLPHIVIAENSDVMRNEPILKLEGNVNGITVSAKCFDENGNVLAVMEKNEFSRHPTTTFRIGGEEKENQLIIYDLKDRPVFDIQLLPSKDGSSVIRVKGNFFFRNGKQFIGTAEGATISGNAINGSVFEGGSLIVNEDGSFTIGRIQ